MKGIFDDMQVHKLIKRKDNVNYYFTQNRHNSRTASIMTYWRKLNKESVAAHVDTKTGKITLADGWSSLPDEVVDAINAIVKG